MPRKQFLQNRNKQLKIINSDSNSVVKPLENEFISYSNYLRKKEETQMSILQKIDYNHSQVSVKKRDSDIFMFLRQKGKEETKKQTLLVEKQGKWGTNQQERGKKRGRNNFQQPKQPNNDNKVSGHSPAHQSQHPDQHATSTKPGQSYQQIDSCAVVIKGRLIYLKQQNGQIDTNDQLLYLLKENSISNKQYLSGNQSKILEKISKNESKKQNQVINDYIMRNMSEQNKGEILIMDRFHEVKSSLFD